MKKDLVIKLIKMIENNRLDEDLVSDLLKRNERLLEMLITARENNIWAPRQKKKRSGYMKILILP